METKKTPRPGGSAPHFFIVAGETSGDMHAARLMKALKEREPLCRFSGVGGAEMAKEGLQSLAPLETTNVVGVWEVARRYGQLRNLLRACSELLETRAFDAFIPVDYPGFNLRLAETARKCGAPVLWYIAPQLWAWGEHRITRLRTLADALFVILPFEEEYFLQRGVEARYVGHPLLETFPQNFAPLADRSPVIALFPGSREQEIKRNLPVMLRGVELLRRRREEARRYATRIARAPHISDKTYKKWIDAARGEGAQLRETVSLDDARKELLFTARAALVKVGTSTLEAALAGTPHLATYRASPPTYWWAKRVIRLQNIALPNILMTRAGEEPITAECIQGEATPESLARELERLLFDDIYGEIMQNRFARLRSLLENAAPKAGNGSASANAAQFIWERLR